MLNFNFISPTRFIFGHGAEEKVGEQCKQYADKVLLHYGGGSIKRSGLYDRVIASLKAAGVDYVELGGVEPNPRLELALEGVKLCKENGINFLLAVGGGSVIDSCKIMAVQLANPDVDAYEKFYVGNDLPAKAIPIGCIPTIAAAGSEGSNSSVVTKGSEKLKRALNVDCTRPVFALLNPELTFTCPQYQTAAGCVDIMAHVFERYFTNTPNVDLTDGFCEAILRTVVKHSPVVLAEPTNYESRAQIQWASVLAHNNICGVDRQHDWGAHRIEHELSALYDVTHGAGLAVISPAWMKYVYKTNIPRFVRYATQVWGIENDPFNPEAVALEGIARTKAFFKSLGMPVTMAEVGAKKEDYDYLAKHSQRNPDGTLGNFVKMDTKEILGVFALAE